jgi:hypothetical protein
MSSAVWDTPTGQTIAESNGELGEVPLILNRVYFAVY